MVYNVLCVCGDFGAAFMLLHILPQVLLGSEAAQLEQYPLRVEMAHCAVYNLHGLVRRYPIQFPHYLFVGKTGIPQRHRIAESAAVVAKGANDDAVQKAG